MASGLAALLDDIAAIAKLSATSLDDVGVVAGKAGTKAAGVVVDDAAVTPRYVTGLSPARELPIISKIALGSFRNKLLILLPAALLLSAFAPWAITPILMMGGMYLCFEGAEKVAEALGHGHHAVEEAVAVLSSEEMEKQRISGAVRTDLILSAEIMAIALADVADSPLLTQGVVLAIVGIGITVAVYGAVGLLVKMDDIGVGLWKRSRTPAIRLMARRLVQGMPMVMNAISTIGMVAMLWVGGGIILHGLEVFNLPWLPYTLHAVAGWVGGLLPGPLAAVITWVINAAGAAIFGLGVGFVIMSVWKLVKRH